MSDDVLMLISGFRAVRLNTQNHLETKGLRITLVLVIHFARLKIFVFFAFIFEQLPVDV